MSPATITLIFLAFAILLFVTEKIPLGLTSMVVCIGLVVTGVLSVGDAFSGFINSNVILFVAMFIVGGALFETGMANEIGSLVTKFAKTERGLIVAIMVIVGGMSGFLSNTGTAAASNAVGICRSNGRESFPDWSSRQYDRTICTGTTGIEIRILRVCNCRSAYPDCRHSLLCNHRI